jgi:ferric-dicitrate binding protein FerR (iron transport regulator)
MNRQQWEDHLAEYLDGTLDEAGTDALLAAAESDPALARELQEWMTLDTRLERYFEIERERIEHMENPVADAHPEPARRGYSAWMGWAAAACLCVMAAVGAHQFRLYNAPGGDEILARLARADGVALILEDGQYRPLQLDEAIAEGRRIKVGGGYAAFALAGEGNLLEVDADSQLTLHAWPDRTEVAMHRGRVWAHLPTDPALPFVVNTAHARVTATGTVFGVEDSPDRSVVRVAEGSVAIEAGGSATTLEAGATWISRDDAIAPPVRQSVAWSQYPDSLAALLPAEATAETVSVQLIQAPAPTPPPPVAPAAAPALGNLLDALPLDTRFYVELPDFPRLRGEFLGTDYKAVLREAAFRAWWQSVQGEDFARTLRDEMRLGELLQVVGLIEGQVVAAVTEKGQFVLIADCDGNADAIRAIMEGLIFPDGRADAIPKQLEALAELNARLGFEGTQMVFGSQPGLVADTRHALAAAEPTGFTDGDFAKKIVTNAGDAPLVVALDLASVLDIQGENLRQNDRNFYDLAGLGTLDYALMAPQALGRGIGQTARLGFKNKRAGMMNWLAEPRPMRSFDFFSEDAHFFAAAALRNPREALYDLMLNIPREEMALGMREIVDYCDAHKEFLDSFGGEVAIALESPVLPVPNVKVVVEMRDPAAFQVFFDELIAGMLADINASFDGVARLETTDHKGRTIVSFVVDGAPVEVSWAFVNDSLVLGPGPRFVADSIDVYESGRGIGASPRLLDLFPARTGSEFSLLVYQDIAKMLPAILENKLLVHLSQADRSRIPDLGFIERYRAPGIAYAYAADSNIDFYLNTPGGIDFNLGMGAPLVANWVMDRIDVGASMDRFIEANMRLERLAAAVEVFREQEGRWPESLGELLRDNLYLDAIPVDPYAIVKGETLRLMPSGDGVALYSVGPDGMDNFAQFDYFPEEGLESVGDIVLRLPREAGAGAGQTGAGSDAAPSTLNMQRD